MKGMAKFLGGFLVGAFTLAWMDGYSIDNGDVVYEDDNMYVTAAKNKSYGYSKARVNWKKPVKED